MNKKRKKELITFVFSAILVVPLIMPVASASSLRPYLVGEWRFDEGFGTTAYDTSGEGNTGSFGGDPQYNTNTSDCPMGYCLEFDGDDYIAGFSGFLEGLTELSISAWVKPISTTYIFQHGSSNSHHGYLNYFQVSSAGALKADIEHAAATGHFYPTTPNGEVEMNKWSHVGMIIDSDSVDFYVNGEQVDSDSFSGMYALAASSSVYRNIGRYYYKSDTISYSNGAIDDVRIYNYALTENQIKKLYNKGLVRIS